MALSYGISTNQDIDKKIGRSVVLWDIYLSGDWLGDLEIDQELDWETVLEKGLVLMDSHSGSNKEIATYKSDTTVESSGISYWRAY